MEVSEAAHTGGSANGLFRKIKIGFLLSLGVFVMGMAIARCILSIRSSVQVALASVWAQREAVCHFSSSKRTRLIICRLSQFSQSMRPSSTLFSNLRRGHRRINHAAVRIHLAFALITQNLTMHPLAGLCAYELSTRTSRWLTSKRRARGVHQNW